MEKLAVLGLFCSGDGFAISLQKDETKKELHIKENTSDNLVSKIMELLEKTHVSTDQIGTLVVCVGPGSFTGSRVAVSFAKGFCMGKKDIKLVPFSTFEYFSYGSDAAICVVPAFSNFVYLSNNGKMICTTKSEAKELCKNAKVVCPKELAQELEIEALLPHNNLIDFVCAQAKKQGLTPKDLKPIYLRASQAEIERERRLQNGDKNS